MNQDQLVGISRIVVPAVCTWLAAKGFSFLGDTGLQGQIVAIVVGVGAVVWSYYTHTDSAKLRSAAGVDSQISIEVPNRVMANDQGVADLVMDNNVPNVTAKRSL
jgi:hypothetical protein